MALPTFETARNELFGLFHAGWTAGTPAVNGGSVPEVRWQGVPVDNDVPPPADSPWARIQIRHGEAAQSSFTPTAKKRYTRTGVVTVQIFSPLSQGGGLLLGEKLAIIARDCFEGENTASGIWFRNARIAEIGPDSTWFQFNVTVEFEYDELK